MAGPFLLSILVFVFFSVFFIAVCFFVPCGWSSWLFVSFWAHVNTVYRIIVSCRILLLYFKHPHSQNERRWSRIRDLFLLFWKKFYCSDSAVLQSLSRRMHQTFVAVGSLYNVLSPKLSNNSVRELIWNSFAMSVDLWFTSYYLCVFVFLIFV